MEDDDDTPDTRIFVSGLPPKLTSNQLGAHFAGRYQITDAVVIPDRRIGFVGFRNYTLAKSAIKYFDKTYLRMSKISVQMAKAVRQRSLSCFVYRLTSYPRSRLNEQATYKGFQNQITHMIIEFASGWLQTRP